MNEPRVQQHRFDPGPGGGDMSRKMIPVEESFAAWRKDPEYKKAYNALDEEFTRAAAMIEARI
jgi:hypothetical protein